MKDLKNIFIWGSFFYLEDYGHEQKIKRKVVFTCRGIKKAGRG